MIPIYPLTTDNILKHRGKMVLACLHDGRTYIGKLTHCKDGHIILNGDDDTALHAANVKPNKKRPSASKNKKPAPKAQVRALYPPYGYPYYGYPPYGYGYGYGYGFGALALSLGLLAFLFLI
ncbi:hypothetical protein MUG84_21790 [Paenibacillus sp. KQZ6P-2]|uniref:Uncharacterized protein n=1 Tax=Paenibacillus mangrovi TaxID=2931978 RepID=A0A9X1WSR8_9BACL|nr:hypothetical protein [Paenibacillus mangrovi]MCJ8014333.1 hypothetical protein [Paenibacillus mangrovi]